MRSWLLLSLFVSRLALADMVPPMPEMKCDAGARWSVSHDGSGCYPTSCEKSEDCGKGQVCQLQGLCITFQTRYGRPNGTPYVDSSANGACDSKKACTSGQCEVIKRCVPKGTKANPGPENKLKTPSPDDLKEMLSPKLPEPTPDPKTPEPPIDPKTPEPPPESQPESQPESTPTKTPTPPTKVDKGRCSVSPVGDAGALSMLFLMFFSVLLLRRRR